MDTYNYRLDSSAQRQPLPQSSDSQAGQAAKKFEAAKNNAFREDFVPNGGPQHRGPIEGGATGPTPEPRPDKMTGADGVSGFLKGEWDFGSKGLEVKKVEVGVTPHFDWTPSKKGIGPGMKDGKPGVAEGDAYGGSVTTPADVKGDAKKGGAAASGKSGVPEGLDWSRGTRIKGDDIKEMKRDIPLAAPKQINDLGPSTNEPEQKKDDTTVA
jgi:hypothetical protein